VILSMIFSLLHSVYTGFVVHPASHRMIPAAVARGVKQPWRESNHSLPSSAGKESRGTRVLLSHTSTGLSA
jgi:hypothetical protein